MRWIAGLWFLLIPCVLVRADLPWPRLDRLSALGINQGGEIEVEVVGADLEGLSGLMFDHPGLSASPLEGKERWFRIKATAETPPGTYDVRTVGRFGVSSPRLLAVSRGLQDVAENTKNHSPQDAQRIELNIAINGMIDGNAEDIYKLLGVKGQRIWIDCQAQRLDSELDGQLSLLDSQGRALATNGDHYGVDPFLDVTLPADGEYFVVLNDLSYRGGYPYRLVVSNLPHVEMVFPAAVQAGTTADLTAYGSNLGQEAKPSSWTVQDQALEELSFAFPVGTDELNLGAYRFRSHPTHHSVLPTAATCTLLGTQAFHPAIDNSFCAQPLLVTDQAVTREVEPNNLRDKPQGLMLPAVLAGRFDAPQDADWYEFKTAPEADDNYYFDVYCERIAGRADPYVAIFDEQGNRVNELDDFGHRVDAFDGHLRDPSGNAVRLTKDKTYRILVQDRYRRGGGRYQYVLEIRRPTPDLFAASIHSDNQRPHALNLWKGTAESLDIVVHQWEGYNGPMTVTAEGLPPGLHSAPLHIMNNTRGNLVIWSDENAPDWHGELKLMIEGDRDGQKFRREVRPYTRVSTQLSSSRPMRSVAAAVREVGPFMVVCEPAELTIEAGQEAALKVVVRRLWPNFKDKISLQNLAWPGQFQMNNFDINADQTEATVTIKVQAGTRPGLYTLALLAQGQVPFHKDPNSKDRPNTLVALPSRPWILNVTEPPKSK